MICNISVFEELGLLLVLDLLTSASGWVNVKAEVFSSCFADSGLFACMIKIKLV